MKLGKDNKLSTFNFPSDIKVVREWYEYFSYVPVYRFFRISFFIAIYFLPFIGIFCQLLYTNFKIDQDDDSSVISIVSRLVYTMNRVNQADSQVTPSM